MLPGIRRSVRCVRFLRCHWQMCVHRPVPPAGGAAPLTCGRPFPVSSLQEANSENIAALPKKASKPQLSAGKRIFHFLISMKLALTLLFVIAILSIIGTILPQGQDVLNSDWPKSPLYDFYNTLGLFNMYYSWWFLSVLGLLVLSLSACIFNRLPTTVKHVFKPRIDVKDAFVANQPLAESFAGGSSVAAAAEVLRRRHYRIKTGKTGSMLAQKGRFSGLASVSFHLSFLLIAAGAVLGGLFGFDYTLSVPNGQLVNVPHSNMQVENHRFDMQFVGKALLDDGRTVQVRQLMDGTVVRDINDGGNIVGQPFDLRPSLYSTDLEIFQNGKSIQRKTIQVNDPLELNGINFYQASFNQSSDGTVVSILEVNHYPGKTLVYIGAFLMMGSITLALYFPHRRIWLKLGKSGRLLIGGRTNRSKLGFKRDFERITADIKLRIGQEAGADDS